MNPKYIRWASDLHLDFDIELWSKIPRDKKTNDLISSIWAPELMSEDAETVMVFAGDLALKQWLFSSNCLGKFEHEIWMEKIAVQFHSVVFVLGNHDLWRGSTKHSYEKLTEILNKFKAEGRMTNVHLLQDSFVMLGDIQFIGSTFWTNYHRGDPVKMEACRNGIVTDFRLIKTNTFKHIDPVYLRGLHEKSMDYIRKNLVACAKSCVVTHMAPSMLSVSEPKHINDPISAHYASTGYEEEIMNLKPTWWIHGHIHTPSRYVLGETAVLCNPRGYYGREINEKFDSFARIEVDTRLISFTHHETHAF